MEIWYEWRGEFDNVELDRLHAAGFDHLPTGEDWRGRLHRHSLGWVCARSQGTLIGFVNVAWDGGVHAIVLDTVVADSHRRLGVGKELVAVAARQARAAGCEWLHADFEEQLRGFYLHACGFRPTHAGLVALA